MISVPFGQYAGSKARRTLHEQLLQSIVQKSIYFFQTMPFGRMMNRFSSDMAVIDKVNLFVECRSKTVFLRFFTIVDLAPFRFSAFFPFSLFCMYISIENRRNKSTTPSIRPACAVLHFAECRCYAMVYRIDVAHLWCLLYSAEILPLFIEVISF